MNVAEVGCAAPRTHLARGGALIAEGPVGFIYNLLLALLAIRGVFQRLILIILEPPLQAFLGSADLAPRFGYVCFDLSRNFMLGVFFGPDLH